MSHAAPPPAPTGAPAAGAPWPTPQAGDPVWLQVGQLFDGGSGATLRDAHLVFDATRIRYLGTADRPPPAELIRAGQRGPDQQLPGHTALPGLTDAHAHLFLEGGELDLEKRAAYLKQDAATLLRLAEARLEPLVLLGVIGVRDAGDRNGVGLALSRQAERTTDRPLMPHLDSPGAAIHHQGRYGSFMGEPLEQHASPRACVEARVAAGADRIKLIPTGIINFKQGLVTAPPQMTTDEIVELVAAAHALGRQTFAHASGDAGIDRVIDGGVDSVEHGFFIRDDQLARLRDRQSAWVPTFAPVQLQVDCADRMGWDDTVVAHLRRILEAHAASLVKAHALGVQIVAGSDAGSVGVAHGFGLLRELELMEAAGLPAAAVLHAATGAGSDRFAYKERFGRLAAGYRSRFLLLERSPLETVSHLRGPGWVVFDGNVYEKDAGVTPNGM